MAEGDPVTVDGAAGIFHVDFSGRIDADALTLRHRALLAALRTHLAPGQAIRLLFDTRGADFTSPGAHRLMREVFGTPAPEFAGRPAFAAIISGHRVGDIGPGEAFFTDEAQAIQWLVSR